MTRDGVIAIGNTPFEDQMSSSVVDMEVTQLPYPGLHGAAALSDPTHQE